MRPAPGNRRVEVIISNPVLACHRTAGALDLDDPPVFLDAVRGLVVLDPPVRVRCSSACTHDVSSTRQVVMTIFIAITSFESFTPTSPRRPLVNEDLRVIGQKLSVAHILEGSVRKSGGKIRLTAQLIRADDGTHLWCETYDRTLDDIFAVQDEIAGEVVRRSRSRCAARHRPCARRFTQPVKAAIVAEEFRDLRCAKEIAQVLSPRKPGIGCWDVAIDETWKERL